MTDIAGTNFEIIQVNLIFQSEFANKVYFLSKTRKI